MRAEGISPLDLNNLPEDYTTRDGKQPLEDTSSSAGLNRKKKSGGNSKEGKDDEAGKVYECRFCSLKFCKSQALGGHMNRHRQERETETLNKARQLVFTSDIAPGAHHLSYVSSGGYHQGAADPTMPFRSPVYPTTRLFSNSSPILTPPPPPPPHQPYMYTSPPRLVSYPTTQVNDYFLGHVLGNSNSDNNYTCIGAPVGQSLIPNGNGGVRDISVHNHQEDNLHWARR